MAELLMFEEGQLKNKIKTNKNKIGYAVVD